MPTPGQLRLWIEVGLWRQGWLWPVSSLVALAALAMWCWYVPMQQAHLADTQQHLHRLAQTAAAARAAPLPRPIEADPAQTSTLALLESAPAVPSQLSWILQRAKAHRIDMTNASYEEHHDEASHLTRLEVDMPLRSTYPQLRALLDEVLREAPNISLDRIEFSRANVSEGIVEAKVHLSLWRIAQEKP